MTTAGGGQGLVLLVELFVHPGREAEFRRFETEASRIMRRHGGRIDRVIRPTGPAQGGDLPHEVHVVSFANPAGLDAYRADPELAALAPLRAAAIARTRVTMGTDGEPYPDGAA
jgi:antibiotic biosynthesis monooxygenase (ABM) superfamily enzyme